MPPVSLAQLAARHGIRPGLSERVGEAAARLGASARMLRYAEDLGLAAPPRTTAGRASGLSAGLAHRQLTAATLPGRPDASLLTAAHRSASGRYACRP
jgi:hypothetical protein